MTFGPGLFRLVLAGLVVLSHLSRAGTGVVAVMLFFILSGYWVTRMYCEKYAGAANNPAEFYLSRFLRLWPVFALAVLLTFALRWAVGLPNDPARLSSLFLIGIAVHRQDPLGVSWSLDLEMQFYLLLPILVLAAQRRLRATGIAVLLIGAGAIWFNWAFHFETVLTYLPAFFAGALIHFRDIRIGRGLALASLAAFVTAGVLMYFHPFTHGVVIGPTRPAEIGRPVAMVWALILWPFVAWNVRQKSAGNDKAMGDLSYSLYLTHYPLIAILTGVAGHSLAGIEKLWAIALIGAVALGFYYLFDRPLEAWRGAFMRRRLAGGPVRKPAG